MEKRSIGMMARAEGLERLINRLPAEHQSQSYLQKELHRTASGARGEHRIEARFNEFYLDEDYSVMWNVQLQLGNWPIQMDGLLLTKRCAIVIESKNISGKIHFNEKTGEFYRFDEDSVKTFMEDPQIQLRKNVRFLSIWFKKHKIPLPVQGLIVFTAKKCEFISKPARTLICKTYQMPEMLLKIHEAHPPTAANLPLLKIKNMLLSSQTPFVEIPLCQRYFIHPRELKAGVFCRNCQSLTMFRTKRSWHCHSCRHQDLLAHEFALQEYFSLIDTTITNERFREFCGLDSRHVAGRLLSQFDLQTTGESKARCYRLKD